MHWEDIVPYLASALGSIWLLSVGGVVYWLRKLDDRQYTMQQDGATKEDLLLTETRAKTEVESVEKRFDHRFDRIDRRFDKIDSKLDRLVDSIPEKKQS